jgi:hypothetical protein
MRFVFWLLFGLLVLIRVPSLAQPAGGDQGLYAYVGQRILHGEFPYRNAWDQKPPGVHYTYALLWAVWPDDRVVAAADLLVAIATALVLWRLGGRLGEGPFAGEAAALLFLLFTNPALTRLGGVRVRGQCEVFIGLAVAAALLLLHRATETMAEHRSRAGWLAGAAGLLFGTAFVYKYNAGAYLGVGLAAATLWPRADHYIVTESPLRAWLRLVVPLVAGFAAAIGVLLAVMALGGALDDLYRATIAYNVFYSGETYRGPLGLVQYLVTFPVRQARLDSLWFLGGLGAACLVVGSLHAPRRLVAPLWIAAACVSIAVNGSRGLPQYFLQALPALALAAGLALSMVWRRTFPLARLVLVALLAVACLRITKFDKAVDYTAWDLRYWRGELPRPAYLARFGERASGDKYSALAETELAAYLRAHTTPDQRVLVLGFSPGALVRAERESATRFFWSRPLIVGFGEGWPGYGVRGLLDELNAARPALVVLQRHDWDPDTIDSATWFMGRPSLVAWLNAGYTPAGELGNYLLFTRANRTDGP